MAIGVAMSERDPAGSVFAEQNRRNGAGRIVAAADRGRADRFRPVRRTSHRHDLR